MVVNGSDLNVKKWNAFCDDHPNAWWWHRWEWLEYCTQFSPQNQNMSFAWEDGDHYTTIIPMVVNPLTHQLQGGGNYLGAPLSFDMNPQYHHVLNQSLTTLGPGPHFVRGVTQFPDTELGMTPSLWEHQQTIRYECYAQLTHVLDLRPPVEELWKGTRNSYRSLIHRQQKSFDFEVVCGVDFWVQDMAQIHEISAGYQTRPVETWQEMGRWLLDRYGLALLCRDRITKAPLAYAYAIVYKDLAYYASHAALPEVVGDCGHALQWEMILALKSRGVKWYELGWQLNQTPKERGISFFKRGFGGQETSFPLYSYSP